jgi:hypothetical protein
LEREEKARVLAGWMGAEDGREAAGEQGGEPAEEDRRVE